MAEKINGNGAPVEPTYEDGRRPCTISIDFHPNPNAPGYIPVIKATGVDIVGVPGLLLLAQSVATRELVIIASDAINKLNEHRIITPAEFLRGRG